MAKKSYFKKLIVVHYLVTPFDPLFSKGWRTMGGPTLFDPLVPPFFYPQCATPFDPKCATPLVPNAPPLFNPAPPRLTPGATPFDPLAPPRLTPNASPLLIPGATPFDPRYKMVRQFCQLLGGFLIILTASSCTKLRF